MMTTSKNTSQEPAGFTSKLSILLLTAMLAACGGGSSSSSGGGSSSSSSSGGDVDTQPQAADDTATGDEDTNIVIDVLQNDDLGEDGISTLVVKTPPQYGQATVNDAETPGDASDDTITYVPGVDFNGEDSFTYEISDTDGDVSEATVTVTVTPTAELSASAAAGGNSTNPKMLKISWTIDVPVDHYRVEINLDGSSGFSDSGLAAIAGDQTETEFEVPLHLTQWEKARLQLIALDQNEHVIERSNEIALDGVNTTSMIGYFKETLPDIDDTTPSDYLLLGSSVALSADASVMAAGAPGYGDTNYGGVYIFHRDTAGWSPYLKSSGEPLWSGEAKIGNDNFGEPIALSADGKYLAVGMPNSGFIEPGSYNTSADYGAVLLFSYDADAAEGEQWKKIWSDANTHDGGSYYGKTLAFSADGKTLVASAGENNSSDPSRVDVLKLDSEGAILERKTIHVDETAYILSVSVSSDGSTVAVGNYRNNEVYIYNSEDNYSNSEVIVANTLEGGDAFGVEIDLSDDGRTLAIGAAFDDTSNAGIDVSHDNLLADSGAVYVFEKPESDWKQTAYIKASYPQERGAFGYPLTLSSDGKVLAVASSEENSAGSGINPPLDGTAEASGAVYTFHKNGDSWDQDSFVKASNTGEGDEFGYSIALSEDGSTMAVGAPWEASIATGIGGNQEDDSNPGSGAVYIY